MLGASSKEVSNPPFETKASQKLEDEDLTFSTPRSELNNPMADPSVLVDSASKGKDKDDAPPAKHSKKSSTSGASLSRIKRADPKDLPSYPSKGYQNLEASAGKAALLAHSQSKSPEIWKPDPLPAAGAAASLANSVKSPEIWNPGPLPTAAAAALLAGDSSKSPDAWQPPATSKSASKAATHVKDKKSVDNTWRPPTATTSNALTAAGLANQNTSKASPKPETTSSTPAYDINRINTLASQNAQNRLTTAHPPPSQAKMDKNMSDILRAATISMAKSQSSPSPAPQSKTTRMPPGSYYSHIPTAPPTVAAEAPSKVNRRSSVAAASIATSSEATVTEKTSKSTYERQTRHYPHLEEAARKAAAERLARLQAEHDKARNASGMPSNWHTQGARSAVTSANARSNSSAPATLRKGTDPEDYARSLKIKSDTAKLGKQIEAVDKDRQAREYLALLAVAEKNVKARMESLETKVAEDQGRVPKHLQEEWDAKAKILSEEYERKRNVELESKKGKINMGGGLWYDQEDLERIAKGNVQPILDEINVKAEKERARLETLRLEREEKERERKLAAERDADTKAEVKKAKVLEKQAAKTRRDAEKAEEKQRKAELKESQRQEKERQRAEKQASKAAVIGATSLDGSQPKDGEQPAAQQEDDMEELEPRPMSAAGHDRVDHERQIHEDRKKEKGWFGSIQKRLSRKDRSKQDEDDSEQMKRKISEPIPFVGDDDGFGHGDDDVSSISSISSPERTSVRDVALAGTVSLSDSEDEDDDALKRRARYIPSDSSITDSDDLYTTRTYAPLTSATYNPVGGDDMPAFVPDVDDSSDDEELNVRSTKSEGEVESPAQIKKHNTFGDLLKKPFEGFSKSDMKKEEQKEKEDLKEQDEIIQAAIENSEERPKTVPLDKDPRKQAPNEEDEYQEARDNFDETGKGVASNAGEGVRIMDTANEKKTSRFSEDL